MKYNNLILCDGKLSNRIKPFDVISYDDAIKFINKLPYGRNQNTDITGVLEERKGTCSTKHAFLAALAEENGLPMKLMLGYYQMNRDNTPQIGNVLAKNFLPFILEGHCYLKCNEQIIDITFPGEIKSKLDFCIIDEQEISPFELYKKPARHKRKLTQWVQDNPNYPLQDIEKLWKVREECILMASLNCRIC